MDRFDCYGKNVEIRMLVGEKILGTMEKFVYWWKNDFSEYFLPKYIKRIITILHRLSHSISVCTISLYSNISHSVLTDFLPTLVQR